LENIKVAPENPNYASVDGILFDKDMEILISYPAGRKEKTYSVPEAVTEIERDAFRHCKNLKEIVIPPSITFIGSSVFYGCDNLESVTLSRHTRFRYYAFNNAKIVYTD
jgi:hypothetical protein